MSREASLRPCIGLIITCAFLPLLPRVAKSQPLMPGPASGLGQDAAGAAARLTQEQVAKMVRDGFRGKRGASVIEHQGIDFIPSDGFLQSLKTAGASKEFVSALCSKKFLALVTLARQSDGLHKAALADGGAYEVGGHDPPIDLSPDLASLTAQSALIVSAKVLKSEATLMDEGRWIESDYTLQIGRVFKGQASAQPLHLAVEGGAYTFPDGSKATQTEWVVKPLVQNVEYFLFLQRAGDRPDLCYLTAVGQAVFEVAPDGRHLYSQTYSSSDHLRQEAKAGRERFVQRLQDLIASQR